MRGRSAGFAGAVAVLSVVTAYTLVVPSGAPLHGVISDAGTSSSGSPAVTPTPRPAVTPVAPAPVLATPSGTSVPSQAALLTQLEPLWSAEPLSLGRVSVSVIDVATGGPVLQDGSVPATTALTPASTTKLVTATAALSTLGASRRLRTRVVAGATPDSVVLVGGGDASLVSTEELARSDDQAGNPAATAVAARPASLEALAAATATALSAAGTKEVSLGYDASLFEGPSTAASWPSEYVTSGVVAPISALMVDSGRLEPLGNDVSENPAFTAARRFAELLADAGITVQGAPQAATARPDAPEVAGVDSPPVDLLVERMLTRSDNELAEGLGHLVALRAGQPATFDGAAAASLAAVADLGVPTAGVTLLDSSGLSPDDRIPASLLANVLSLAAGKDGEQLGLRPLVSGLPVGGFSGTLEDRFVGTDSGGAGTVRAKTGTLGTTSTLAGLVTDRDDRVLAFSILADQLPLGTTLDAREVLDELALTLQECGC